jgi:hypothetical protein
VFLSEVERRDHRFDFAGVGEAEGELATEL